MKKIPRGVKFNEIHNIGDFVKRSLIALLSMSLLAVGAQAEEEVRLSKGELCVKGARFPVDGAEYKKSDTKRENNLCSYDMHGPEIDVCPKLFSTFPAVELFEAGVTCSKRAGGKSKGEKLAKYKYSTSCSKTPSILGYYHVSRALGIKIVPPTVARSMDLKDHIAVLSSGYKKIQQSGELIAKVYAGTISQLKKKKSALVSEDGNYSYGALSYNPGGEHFYSAFYPKAGGAAGVPKFKRLKVYRNLNTKKPISEMVGTAMTDENFVKIQQMKDAADMIILDTIFGQRDRMGNMAAYDVYLTQVNGKIEVYDNGDIKDLIKESGQAQFEEMRKQAKSHSSKDKKRQALITVAASFLKGNGLPFAKAQRALMKDNDCGLKRENYFRANDMIEGVYHVSRSTYDQLMKLAQVVDSGQADGFLINNLVMNSTEMDEFKTNLKFVARHLNQKCIGGRLFLDLNVKSHFAGTNQADGTCGHTEAPRPTTEDGFEIYPIVGSGINVRTEGILTKGYGSAETLYLGGTKTVAGDLVAVIETVSARKAPDSPTVTRFKKVRVIQSNHMKVGDIVYIWENAF